MTPAYKYIFIAGAPGSKWSSVNKNIYFSPSIDNSDYSEARTYSHDAPGEMTLMHIGAYFDPGMEFDLPESMSTLTRVQAEKLFDAPFSGTGVRIIKSHIFSYYENIQYLKELWPECPIITCYRNDDECLGWWVKCGHFNITYPTYAKYYKELRTMGKLIERQNKGVLEAMERNYDSRPTTNLELCKMIGIEPPPEQYRQDYTKSDVKVTLL